MPAFITLGILLTLAFGPNWLSRRRIRRQKDRHPVERFTQGSSLDQELEELCATIEVDTSEADRGLVAAWQGAPVTAAYWDDYRGSLLVEAGGVAASIALANENAGRQVENMVRAEKTWAVGHTAEDGTPAICLRSQSWRIWLNPLGVHLSAGPSVS